MAPEDPYRVSDLVPEEWPNDVVERLTSWRQGDLLRGQNLSWLAAPDDLVTGQDSTERLGAVELGPIDNGLLVVTSQTCDIAGTGTGRHFPFVQVCPVLDASDFDPSRRLEIAQYRIGYLVPLSALNTGDSFMVADLRISIPVSKGALVQVDNGGSAFADEQTRINFAEALAVQVRRPTLHDAVSETLIRSFSGHFKGQRPRKQKGGTQSLPAAAQDRATASVPQRVLRQLIDVTSRVSPALGQRLEHARGPRVQPATLNGADAGEAWWREVEQVRLIVHGDRLRPTSVQLVVITSRNFTELEKAPWWGFAGQAKNALKPAGIRYDETILFQTLDQLSARLYKNSVPLRLSELGHPPTF